MSATTLDDKAPDGVARQRWQIGGRSGVWVWVWGGKLKIAFIKSHSKIQNKIAKVLEKFHIHDQTIFELYTHSILLQ